MTWNACTRKADLLGALLTTDLLRLLRFMIAAIVSKCAGEGAGVVSVSKLEYGKALSRVPYQHG